MISTEYALAVSGSNLYAGGYFDDGEAWPITSPNGMGQLVGAGLGI